MSDTAPRRRRLLARSRTVLTIAATTAVVAPAAAMAAGSFTDVSASDYYASAVDWAKAAGVTSGCNPAQGNTKFCPNDTVSRGQMAVFLNNLDTKNVFLTPTEKAADSDKLDGLDSSAFLRTTGKAADAEKLDGKDSTYFLPTTGTAADSSKLGGTAASAYLATDAGTIAYAWACNDQGDEPYDVADCLGSGYNTPDGRSIMVDKTATGTYLVTIPTSAGTVSGSGVPVVSAYRWEAVSSSPRTCMVDTWTAEATFTDVVVICFDTAGALADSAFTFHYVI